jgi:4-carboxymuconolactone decarboxylase
MTDLPETDKHAHLGGRLPLLYPGELTPEQLKLYRHLEETKISTKNADFQAMLPDGRLLGPFNAFLYSPLLGKGFMDWTDAESLYTSLSAPLRQIISLTVATAWQASYELYAHSAMGQSVGLTTATINAIKQGREPEGLTEAESAGYRFTSALVTQREIPDDLYQQARAAFSLTGVVELVHLVGHYLVTSALLKAFGVPEP